MPTKSILASARGIRRSLVFRRGAQPTTPLRSVQICRRGRRMPWKVALALALCPRVAATQRERAAVLTVATDANALRGVAPTVARPCRIGAACEASAKCDGSSSPPRIDVSRWPTLRRRSNSPVAPPTSLPAEHYRFLNLFIYLFIMLNQGQSSMRIRHRRDASSLNVASTPSTRRQYTGLTG